ESAMQVMDLREDANGRDRRRFALFDYGFRPFFLLAGLDAAIMIPIWVFALRGRTLIPAAIPPLLWHGHEMLFGFVAAAMAGFLLTTVPTWPGRQRLHGAPLIALVVLLLAGRAALLAPTAWWWFLAPLDLAFLPVLS